MRPAAGQRVVYYKLVGGVIARSPLLAGMSAFGAGFVIGTILRAVGIHA